MFNLYNIIIITTKISFALSVLISIIMVAYNLKRKNDIELAKIDLNFNPSENDFIIIDKLINEEVSKYHVLRVDSNNIQYMNEANINEMESYILRYVLNNISPILLGRLKYIYNPEKLEDIICEKVKIAVISYSIDFNGYSTNNEQEETV